MKLYLKPGACSLSPHIALEESGLPYETESVDLKNKVTASGADFWKSNPKGYVPALLLDSGELLTEGAAIVQYIADQAPTKNLAPANGTLARYRLQSLLNFIGTELHKGYSPLFNPATPDAYKTIARDKLVSRYKWVDDQLAGKDFVAGEHFSVADAYLFTVTSWAKHVGVDLSAYANVTAYMARIGARPAVQEALKAEGLLQ